MTDRKARATATAETTATARTKETADSSGNDKQKGKSKCKGNSRSFDCAALRMTHLCCVRSGWVGFGVYALIQIEDGLIPLGVEWGDGLLIWGLLGLRWLGLLAGC
jgi:hypothetical protein